MLNIAPPNSLNRRRLWRVRLEAALLFLFAALSGISIAVTVGIVMAVLFESVQFFGLVDIREFLFGLHWSPQIAIRADQVGATGHFGFIPLLTGTLLISTIAMAIAVPVGLVSAIYLAEFAPASLRRWLKPILEILAGIPTIVYGFFAIVVLSPIITDFFTDLGFKVAGGENALSAGIAMGFLLLPFITSLSEDAFHALPYSLREGALGLGSTKYEMVRYVTIPAALPGIASGVLLAFSRAVGETMIVVMAAGISANLTANPLDSVTTITVQIVTLLTGDQEFDDPKTLAAFALGLTLFVITLLLNLVALHIVRRYREQYD